MDIVINTVRSLRNIRQSLNIPLSSKFKITVYSQSCEKEVFELAKPYVMQFARVEEMKVVDGTPSEIPPQSATAVVGASRIIVPLAGLIGIEKETQRQKKKLDTLLKEKQSLEGRVNNPKFVDNAPKELVDQTKARIEEIKGQTAAIEELLKSLIG
jgi:valyl-tRNA synthetase